MEVPTALPKNRPGGLNGRREKRRIEGMTAMGRGIKEGIFTAA